MVSGRVLTSQTIGVEFSSKIIRVGTGARRQRIKLQLWDTAGTERFRSVSRSYYRGAAGAVLVYDITSQASFNALPTFLNDARALASPNLTVLLAGNKSDISSEAGVEDNLLEFQRPRDEGGDAKGGVQAVGSVRSLSARSSVGYGLGAQLAATTAPDGREVSALEASRWASAVSIPVAVEVSALNGEGVDEIFARLARMILTKIELGEIDPDDPQSGIQYGDSAAWADGDGQSVKSGVTTIEEGGLGRRRRKGGLRGGAWTGMREWEEVFRLDGVGRRRRGGCC